MLSAPCLLSSAAPSLLRWAVWEGHGPGVSCLGRSQKELAALLVHQGVWARRQAQGSWPSPDVPRSPLPGRLQASEEVEAVTQREKELEKELEAAQVRGGMGVGNSALQPLHYFEACSGSFGSCEAAGAAALAADYAHSPGLVAPGQQQRWVAAPPHSCTGRICPAHPVLSLRLRLLGAWVQPKHSLWCTGSSCPFPPPALRRSACGS